MQLAPLHQGGGAGGRPAFRESSDPNYLLLELRGNEDEQVSFLILCEGKEGLIVGKQGATIKEIITATGVQDIRVERGMGRCTVSGRRGDGREGCVSL
jgi:hypothetical protein